MHDEIMKPHINTMTFDRRELSNDQLITLYKQLLFPRMIEEKMLNLLRQGKISKWFSGIGQEAISVGTTAAMNEDEFIFTMHRNLGVFTTRNLPLERLIAQWQGKEAGYTKGRDRSFHFGSKKDHIVGMISHLGPQLSLADGVALGHKLSKENKCTLAFTGEGGTSEGEFHEALNVASVWDLPVIFVIENNKYGLSTPIQEQYNCKHLVDRAEGYGMKGVRIDGNNILEVYHTVRDIAEEIRSRPAPVLIECETFRMRGHEEASGTKYVPDELMEQWAKKDPLDNFEKYLIDEGLLDEKMIDEVRSGFKDQINQAVEKGFSYDDPTPIVAEEQKDVYAPFEFNKVQASEQGEEMRLVDAIKEGLDESMQKFDNLVLMGQDIAEYGGVFKITEGFIEKYGAERVRNTPLCESAIIGTGLGLSIKGFKSMVEMQFADFVSCGFNQIVNNLAKLHYRWQENADVVLRMPTGGMVGSGPFHSQSNEAWFAHTPGLKVVYPSNAYDAKGLLITAFEDPNPVLYFEHKALYRSVKDWVPNGYYNIPFGEARIVQSGNKATIITYGLGVKWAVDWSKEHNTDIEIIDLRTLVPLDWDCISKSVKKTHRALILHEDNQTGGMGGEWAAMIGEELFAWLDAPVMRCTSLDTPIPFANNLEKQYMAVARLEEKMNQLLTF